MEKSFLLSRTYADVRCREGICSNGPKNCISYKVQILEVLTISYDFPEQAYDDNTRYAKFLLTSVFRKHASYRLILSWVPHHALTGPDVQTHRMYIVHCTNACLLEEMVMETLLCMLHGTLILPATISLYDVISKQFVSNAQYQHGILNITFARNVLIKLSVF